MAFYHDFLIVTVIPPRPAGIASGELICFLRRYLAFLHRYYKRCIFFLNGLIGHIHALSSVDRCVDIRDIRCFRRLCDEVPNLSQLIVPCAQRIVHLIIRSNFSLYPNGTVALNKVSILGLLSGFSSLAISGCVICAFSANCACVSPSFSRASKKAPKISTFKSISAFSSGVRKSGSFQVSSKVLRLCPFTKSSFFTFFPRC